MVQASHQLVVHEAERGRGGRKSAGEEAENQPARRAARGSANRTWDRHRVASRLQHHAVAMYMIIEGRGPARTNRPIGTNDNPEAVPSRRPAARDEDGRVALGSASHGRARWAGALRYWVFGVVVRGSAVDPIKELPRAACARNRCAYHSTLDTADGAHTRTTTPRPWAPLRTLGRGAETLGRRTIHEHAARCEHPGRQSSAPRPGAAHTSIATSWLSRRRALTTQCAACALFASPSLRRHGPVAHLDSPQLTFCLTLGSLGMLPSARRPPSQSLFLPASTTSRRP